MKKYTTVWVLWDRREESIARIASGWSSKKRRALFLRKCDFTNSRGAKLLKDQPLRYVLKEIPVWPYIGNGS